MGMEETVQQAIMEAIQQVCVLILFIVLKKKLYKNFISSYFDFPSSNRVYMC